MGRRKVGTLPADPELARARLLDVAEACFERYGIRRTTMEDIANEARVSRPTVYRYFGDRDSLIRTIAQRRAASFAERMQEFFRAYDSLEEELVEGLLYLGRIGRRDPFFGALVTADTVGEVHQVLMDSAAAIDFARDVWEPVLQRAQARGELAEDVSLPAAYRWLTAVNILLIGWYENEGEATPEHRHLLESFVVPAFRQQVPRARLPAL